MTREVTSGKLATRLDNSFQFLLTKSEDALMRYASDRTRFLSWLAGLVDADGHIRICNSNGVTRINLEIASTNHPLLESIGQTLTAFGYYATGPYRTHRSGFTTPYSITYTKDMWHLYVQRNKEVQLLLASLPNRHREKILQKELALSMRPPAKWIDIEPKVQKIRQGIQEEVSAFKEQAQREYEKRREAAEEDAASSL